MKAKKSILIIFFSAALLFIFLSWSAVSAYSSDAETQSIILYVKAGANGNCTSWANACELQTALTNAGAGDQIWVAKGTYIPTADPFDRAATFQLKSDVAIYGGFPVDGGDWGTRDWETNITKLSGNIGDSNNAEDNNYHVVTGSGVDATAVLDGFTISGGHANGSTDENNDRGGGMYNYLGSPSLSNVTFSGNSADVGGGILNYNYSSPSLSNVTFSDNSADSGGGMYNSSSSPSLSNVTFSSNNADSGGGMYNFFSSPSLSNVTFSSNSADYGGGMYNDYSSPNLSNVTFSDNTATGDNGYGGGMYNESSSPSLINVTFSSNSAVYYGGGMYNYKSSFSLSNVTFSGNSAKSGGGMYNNDNSNPSLSNVTFSSNSATNHGGGMYNNNYSNPSLSNVTFSGNSATNNGGGMYNYDNSSPTVTNSILWGNNPEQVYNDSLSSVTVTYSDIQGSYQGEGNINEDPLLGLLADNGGFTQTRALRKGSPAIDAGDPLNCPATDQRGAPRPFNGDGIGTAICDMGAYEYATFSLTLTIAGSGSVTKDPDKLEYLWGEEVTLTATADPGWTFSSWGGEATGATNPLTITIEGNTSITAIFVQEEYYLDVIINPYGTGSVAIDPLQDTYHYGDVVILTAVPETDWVFNTWGGDASGNNNVFTLTIEGNHSVTANFINPSADILYVKAGTSGTCASWADACELQTALTKAVAGNQIWVAAGTYKPTAVTDRTATFQLKSGVAIYGGFPAAGGEMAERNWTTNLTTLSGDIEDVGDAGENSYHVVTGSGVDNTAVLDGFTISGGNANGNSPNDSGGGMYNASSSPSLTNVTFSSNSATNYGGGMYNEDHSSPSLINVTFSDNTVTGDYGYGGGMSNASSSPILSNVTFSNNSALHGGGMFNYYNSSPSLSNVTFSSNSATTCGGGMYNEDHSSPSLSNVTFSSNSATTDGGGMYNFVYSSPSLTNVTFSSNSALRGGGMYNAISSPSLSNVTFSSNSGGWGGGGMYNNKSNPTVTNSILWGNTPEQIFNDLGSVTVTYSDIQGGGYPGTGNINADPLLGPLADNGGFTQTHALGAGSPAIDTGDPSNCPVIDQRAFARPIDGDGNETAICDMGAYEYASHLATFSLTLEVSPEGKGTVSISPLQDTYHYGDEVTLTATADPGWTFLGWSGDATGADNPLTITIESNTSITATFTQDEYTLTVTPNGSGTVSVDPLQPTYHYGDEVSLTATADPGWTFSSWGGAATGADNPLSITIEGNTSITATFTQDEYTLTVTPSGSGTVSVEPVKPTYHYGDEVTLTASAQLGWTFAEWSEGASGSENPLSITIEGNTSITATFTQDEYTLTVTPSGSGIVSVDPVKSTYHYDDEVTLTATANPGWIFLGWSGDASGTDNPLSITIEGNTSITAEFINFTIYLPLILR